MGTRRTDVLRQIGSDADLKKEILDRISGKPGIGDELVSGHLAELPRGSMGLENLRVDVNADDAVRVLESPSEIPRPEDAALEAIIWRLGRPVLLVRNDDFDVSDLETDVWKARLNQHRDNLKAVILSVGRVEVKNNPTYTWVGTGWVVADELIVTNRHVAREFAVRRDQGLVFRQSFLGQMEARLDFREEHQAGGPAEFDIVEVLHIEDDDGPDLAFLRIDWASNASCDRRTPVPLGAEVTEDQMVAVVGYPAKDTRTNISEEMDTIFGNIYDVKRLAPGQIMKVFEGDWAFAHDCTSLGGSSGSIVCSMETGEAVGLHFAGREEVANFAVAAPVVKNRLEDVMGWRADTGIFVRAGVDEDEDEKAPSAESLEERGGYDPGFLGEPVPLPKPSSALWERVAPVSGRTDGLLHYTNYSVMMDATRRLAVFAVCNVDGKELRRIRRGRDRWYFDPRMDRAHQVGNELYRSNKLDRGHLVRRLDTAWGATYEDAQFAQADTFFYTNCAPQHKELNQDLWLGLENHILDNADAYDLKVSVFSGPVFRPTDRLYRGFQVPEDFWKVVAMTREESGELSVTGYMLSQVDFMDDLEFAFGAYSTYQVPVSQIEALTGLDFGELKSFDPLAERETRPYVVLESLAGIVL